MNFLLPFAAISGLTYKIGSYPTFARHVSPVTNVRMYISVVAIDLLFRATKPENEDKLAAHYILYAIVNLSSLVIFTATIGWQAMAAVIISNHLAVVAVAVCEVALKALKARLL